MAGSPLEGVANAVLISLGICGLVFSGFLFDLPVDPVSVFAVCGWFADTCS
jgi:hypothetical protein